MLCKDVVNLLVVTSSCARFSSRMKKHHAFRTTKLFSVKRTSRLPSRKTCYQAIHSKVSEENQLYN